MSACLCEVINMGSRAALIDLTKLSDTPERLLREFRERYVDHPETKKMVIIKVFEV